MKNHGTLLADYAANGSESAFRELVECYLDLVYSVAVRLVNGNNKVTDSSGKGNNGQASGVRGVAEGRQGGGYAFTAAGDEIKVADGQWHHVVATFNGTAQLLFVDGKPESTPVRWTKPGWVVATDINLVIGCNRSNLSKEHDDLGVSFRRLIDEPMAWNRALSEKEVAFLDELHNRPPAGPAASN